MLPRLATALAGEIGKGWGCSFLLCRQRLHIPPMVAQPRQMPFPAAAQQPALLCCSSSAAAQEQRRLAVAFYHAKQKVELLRPSGTAEAAACGSSMAVDAGA